MKFRLILALLLVCFGTTACVNFKPWDREGGETTGEWSLGKSIPIGRGGKK